MEFVKKSLGAWIRILFVFVIGVLCIVAGAVHNGGGDATVALETMSMISGIILIVVGCLAVILAVMFYAQVKKEFIGLTLPGAIMVALGVSLIIGKYFDVFIGVSVYVIPYCLIAAGIIFFASSIIELFKGIKAKGKVGLAIVLLLVSAGIAAIGFLCVGNNPVISYSNQFIIYGVITVVSALIATCAVAMKKPDVIED